jgi:hypothetical protein
MLNSIHTALGTPTMTPRIAPDDPEKLEDLTDEEKKEIVLRDPKWGMCSMMSYMLMHGNNKECSHVFGRQFCLPIVVFLSQWLLFFAIIMHNLTQPMTCGSKNIQSKLLVISVSLIYFVNSFFLYDDIRDRSRQMRVACSSSYLVMLDAFQEHIFNLFVNIANLWIVYTTEDFVDALFNSLALEFLMNLDNSYESLYFKYRLKDAVDIYDNHFMSLEDSHKKVQERTTKSQCFRIFRYLTFVPFKLLGWGFIVFPIYCLVVGLFAVMC